jgi:hypothetical protein
VTHQQTIALIQMHLEILGGGVDNGTIEVDYDLWRTISELEWIVFEPDQKRAIVRRALHMPPAPPPFWNPYQPGLVPNPWNGT